MSGPKVCSECGAALRPFGEQWRPGGIAYVHADASEAADCWNTRGDREPRPVDASEVAGTCWMHPTGCPVATAEVFP